MRIKDSVELPVPRKYIPGIHAYALNMWLYRRVFVHPDDVTLRTGYIIPVEVLEVRERAVLCKAVGRDSEAKWIIKKHLRLTKS